MIALLLLAACGPDPAARQDDVFAPALARLDTDKDGRVVLAEYERVSFLGPTFADADADGDGVLSVAELRTVALATDPIRWYPERRDLLAGGPPDRAKAEPPGGERPGPHGPGPGPRGDAVGHRAPLNQSPARMILAILKAEVVAADPTVPVPSDDELAEVGRKGRLDTDEARALLARLEAASAQANVGFPASLRAERPPATGAAR